MSNSVASVQVEAPIDWSSGIREHIYPLPGPHDPQLGAARVRVPAAQRRSRILRSANTQGQISLVLDATDNRVDRVIEWHQLPDLLYWNPFRYFTNEDHASIDDVWLETVDSSTYTASSGRFDPAAVISACGSVVSDASTVSMSESNSNEEEPLSAAIVLRRSELTYPVLSGIRFLQEEYFLERNLLFPACSEFRSTLHGR